MVRVRIAALVYYIGLHGIFVYYKHVTTWDYLGFMMATLDHPAKFSVLQTTICNYNSTYDFLSMHSLERV